MKWTPLRGWCVVVPVETEEKFSGGLIVIPDTVRDTIAKHQYEVVSYGGPRFREPTDEPETPPDLHPGDWVLTSSRRALVVEGEDLTLLREIDVWAVSGDGTASPHSPR